MKDKRFLIFLLVLIVVLALMFVACDQKNNDVITWGNWTVVTEPTTEKVGKITRTASDGTVEEFELPIINEINYTKTIITEATCESAGQYKIYWKKCN